MTTDADVDLKNKIITAVREGTGLHEPLAVPVAENILRLLQSHVGGSRVYIPSANKRLIKERNRRVLADFDGANHEQVCAQHGISKATLYRILNK